MHQYCNAHHKNGMRRVRQRDSVKEHRLLQHIGEGDLTTCNVQDAEEFVCMLYRVENVAKIDEARWEVIQQVEDA